MAALPITTYCEPSDILLLFDSIDSRFSPARLKRYAQMASAFVDNFCRRSLVTNTYTAVEPLIVDKNSLWTVRVHNWPILSVTSLAYRRYFEQQFTTITDLTKVDVLQPPERYLYYHGNVGLSPYDTGETLLTYTAGYGPPFPEDLVLATALVSQELIMRGVNPLGAQSISVSANGSSNSLSIAPKSINMLLAEQMLEIYQAKE